MEASCQNNREDCKDSGYVKVESTLPIVTGLLKRLNEVVDLNVKRRYKHKLDEVVSKVIVLGSVGLLSYYETFYEPEDRLKKYQPYQQKQPSSYPLELSYIQKEAENTIKRFGDNSIDRIRSGLEKRINSVLTHDFGFDSDLDFKSSKLRGKIRELPNERIFYLYLKARARGYSDQEIGKRIIELFLSEDTLKEYEIFLKDLDLKTEEGRAKRLEKEAKLIESSLKSMLNSNHMY